MSTDSSIEEKNHNSDIESGPRPGKGPKSVSHWRLVIDQALITPEVENWKYNGSGTDEDPYVSIIISIFILWLIN